MLAAIASKCKKELCSSTLYYPYHFYSSTNNLQRYGSDFLLYFKGIRCFSNLRGTRNCSCISYVQYIPVRASMGWSFDFVCFVGYRSLSTKASLEETTNEILNQILAAMEDPSVSREDICIPYIQNLCATGNFLAASRLVEILGRKRIFLSSRAYNFLLEASGQKNDIDLVSQVFKDLLVYFGSIRLTSYLILARAFSKHNDPAVLLNFITEISKMALPRIDIILNRLIFAFAKCGNADMALLIFGHMKSLKCKPDLVTYNTILAILSRLGCVDEMLQEFAFMKTVDLVPDTCTYNTILNCLRKMGRLDLCLSYFEEMKEKGIQPDLMTFKALIECLGRSGNIEKALEIFDWMKCRQIHPSIHIYRALIFSLKKMGKVELAAKLSKEMNESFPIFAGLREQK